MALKAREALILGQMPSYEERLVQMEAILKASVTSSVYGEQGTTNRYEVICAGPHLINVPQNPFSRDLARAQRFALHRL